MNDNNAKIENIPLAGHDDSEEESPLTSPISVRPITIMRRIQPTRMPIVSEEIENKKHFTYFPELHGCRNLINLRPIIFHWVENFLSISGHICFEKNNLKEDAIKLFFINQHLLIRNGIQFYIAKEYYDRPFLCHIENNGNISTHACKIDLDTEKMEYYIMLIETPTENVLFLFDTKVRLYFSGEVMLSRFSETFSTLDKNV